MKSNYTDLENSAWYMWQQRLTTQEIARELGVTGGTVKRAIMRVYRQELL